MKKSYLLILFLIIIGHYSFGQNINPFTIRYQVNQKGGLVMMANTSVGCNCSANNEMPPSGSGDNNDYTMSFVDIDSDASTYMSSSDQLNLPSCSEVTWAGLYWTGQLNTTPSTTPNFSNRNKVKLSIDGGTYLNLTADELFDNTVGKTAYFCFKDITSLVQANTINSSYRVGNVVTQTGTNTFGGWTIVVVYNNVYQPMKNLTVFNGLANVSTGASVTIPLSGFLTPPTGPVNFELGVIAHDGDRAQTGDQLSFNGTGSYVNISDALHLVNNSFNSTISNNSVLTPLRNPSYNNNLGHDANIYIPDNSTFNYLGNAASTASIRLSTVSETVLTSVISSAVDIYVPDLRASVSYTDLNGGTVVPGDVLEYSISAKNIGSDVSIDTYLTDTLDSRLTYIPGTISVTYGPNAGAKTDITDLDQSEFISVGNIIRARIGTGANGSTGGAVVNSTTGADSTVIKFRVQLTNECAVWQCGPTLENKAFLFGTGQISGIPSGNNGASDLLDLNGCPSLASGIVTVDVTSCPDTVITYTDSLCVGETLFLSFPNSSYLDFQWTGPDGFTSTINNPSIPNAQLINAGDYVLHVSYNGVDCISDSTAPVFISTHPTMQLNTIQDDSCYNMGSGFINVNGIGNAPFTYTWSNSDQDSLAGNLTAGTYSVVIADQYGCTVTDTFTVSQPPQITTTTTITSDYNGSDISCYGEADGAANVTASGGIAPYTYQWSPSLQATAAISGLSAGVHTVMVTDDNGCQTTNSLTLVQPDTVSITAVLTNILCYGSNSGAINTTITGGTTPYTYHWSTGATSEDLVNLTEGIYTDTVSDINGCSTLQSFTITQPLDSITITAVTTDNLCFGDSTGTIDVTVAGGVAPYTYAWSTTAVTQDLDSLAGGIYTLTVTDSNNCVQTLSVTINTPSEVQITETHLDPVCQNGTQGSIDLTVSGGTPGYLYAWNNGQTTQDILNLNAGSYQCSVTDLNGCLDTITVPITDPDALVISEIQTNVLCYSDSSGVIDITISNGTPDYVYDWSDGQTTQDAVDLPAGLYWVDVTDLNSCGAFMSFQITEPDTALYIDSFAVTHLLCYNDSVGAIAIEVAGGTGTYTYLWNNSAITQDVEDLQAGIYSVVITDANLCQLIFEDTIAEPSDLVISETHTDVLCFGDSTGSIDITVVGGVEPYSYLWDTTDTIPDLNQLPLGTYSLTVTDANGCFDTISVTLSQPTFPLALSAVSSNVLCSSGDNGSIDLSVSGGTPDYDYLWNTTDTLQDLDTLTAGTYSVTVTDTNGCQDTLSIVISEPNPLTVSAQIDPTCFGDTLGAIDITVTGGVTPYTYQWSNSETTQDIQDLGAGTYTVVVTDSNSCQTTYIDSILQPTAINLTETHVNVLCYGDAIGSINVTTVGGEQPYTFLWTNFQTNEDLTNIAAGNYSLYVTDSDNCKDTIDVTITQPLEALNLTSTTTDVLCNGDDTGSIDLSVTGGTADYTYLWDNGEETQDLADQSAGTYNVVVTDANGCTETTTAVIDEPSEPLTLTTTANSVCYGTSNGEASVTASGGTPGYQYQWSTNSDDTLATVEGLVIGAYSVEVTDANGCVAIASATVELASAGEGCVTLEMPNVMTPNGDNTNDLFLPVNIFGMKDFHISIFNRWGNLMYESTSYTEGWNGMIPDGTPASDGVYFWIVNYTDVYNTVGKMSGNLTLIRE